MNGGGKLAAVVCGWGGSGGWTSGREEKVISERLIGTILAVGARRLGGDASKQFCVGLWVLEFVSTTEARGGQKPFGGTGRLK